MRHRPDPVHVLLKASAKSMTLNELRRALEPKLRPIIHQVCAWEDDAAVGDHQFCSFSFSPTKDVSLYVQFYSEPDGDVLWEVSSGNWHAPTKAYMRGERSKKVRQAGFRIGGEARNFEREVSITTPQEVRAVARQVVDLLYEALDYRGQQPLHVEAIRDTSAPRMPVYEALSPDDLATILERGGFTCEIGDTAKGTTPLYVNCRGLHAMVLLMSKVKGADVYQVAAIGPSPKDALPDVTLTADNALVATFGFPGGVTAEWICLQVDAWFQAMRALRRQARQTRPAAQDPTKLVH